MWHMLLLRTCIHQFIQWPQSLALRILDYLWSTAVVGKDDMYMYIYIPSPDSGNSVKLLWVEVTGAL